MDAPRLLTSADLDDAVRLKDAVGWNQTRQDWINVLELSPQGCFALDCDGRLAATATNVCFGDRLAWIGMVLTFPEFRGRGFARRLLERSIGFCEAQGVDWIKLDATDMGRPLYEKLGFVDECVIERWARQPGEPVTLPEPAPVGAAPLYDLDRAACGADRAALLRLIAPMGCVAVASEGYAMGRPGSKASYFGPCVARSVEAARDLLRWRLARHPAEPVYWDILAGNPAAQALASEFGFAPLRRLIRMARPGRPNPRPLGNDDSLTFGIAGFEYG